MYFHSPKTILGLGHLVNLLTGNHTCPAHHMELFFDTSPDDGLLDVDFALVIGRYPTSGTFRIYAQPVTDKPIKSFR